MTHFCAKRLSLFNALARLSVKRLRDCSLPTDYC